MTSCRFIIGDTRDVLRTLPDGSVDLVLMSPPFLALRSYLPADHPDKQREIGSEATPGEFIDTLLDVVEECRRVLAQHGSIAIELGDTYSGSGGAGGDYLPGGWRDSQQRFGGSGRLRASGNGGAYDAFKGGGPGGPGWPLDKSLTLVPELFRISLVYGTNPLTGRATPRWRARNVVRWCRPNPPVGALGDKFRPATSEMVVACVDRRRYFDLDAVRGPGSPNTHARLAQGIDRRPRTAKTCPDGNRASLDEVETAGAPPLDWWNIPTQPYAGSHYATWPEDLCVRPIKAMCPEKVCTVCGKPSERITETVNALGVAAGRRSWRADPVGIRTLGWTDCGHGSWRPGVVLDPFAGSGTTLAVAFGHSRDSIGIDLDSRNAELARQRVGMWLEVEQQEAVS